MTKNNKKNITSLDSEIELIQTEKYINDFDNHMKSHIKNKFKKFGITISPLILSSIGYLIFKNPTIIAVGVSITGISSIATITNSFIHNIKNQNINISSYNPINNVQEENKDEILHKNINKNKSEDFYSEEYKNYLENDYIETEEEKKISKSIRTTKRKISKNYYNKKKK